MCGGLVARSGVSNAQKWLEDHPGVEVVSRDRATTYALAVSQALPQAVQVADRWHLLKNLGEAIQRVLEANRATLKQAAQELAQEEQATAQVRAEIASAHIEAKESTSRREQLYQQVKAYQAAGRSLRWVATKTGVVGNTVHKYWYWSAFQPKTRSRCSPIYQFEAYLRKRWQEDQQHLDRLHEEVRQQGFLGSRSAVYRLVSQWPRDE